MGNVLICFRSSTLQLWLKQIFLERLLLSSRDGTDETCSATLGCAWTVLWKPRSLKRSAHVPGAVVEFDGVGQTIKRVFLPHSSAVQQQSSVQQQLSAPLPVLASVGQDQALALAWRKRASTLSRRLFFSLCSPASQSLKELIDVSHVAFTALS
jgi:hypothetical protein